jgi:putative SOS response-associated peptidase YedK
MPDLDQATSTGYLSTSMCNLYSLNKKRDAVARFFRVSHNRAPMFEPVPAIFPRHVAPVVRATADVEREIVTMSWGFMLLQNGKAPRPVTNVRDDTILKSSFWKSSFVERRCLVPATSFCEPNGDVKRRPGTGLRSRATIPDRYLRSRESGGATRAR